MKPNVLQNLEKNELLPEEAKAAFREFWKISEQVQFGKIDKNNEGYILNDLKLPRCTSILQMDGTKAGALMEWAKREVVNFARTNLKYELENLGYLTDGIIDSILDDALMNPDKQKNDAADHGTTVHDNIENYLTGYGYEDNESLGRFKEAWRNFGGCVVATEIPVVWHDNRGRGFGGRVDALCYKNGIWYIGDNKTSRSVHTSYACQVSGYGHAIEQMSDGKISPEKGVIFHIPDFTTMNDRQKKEYEKKGSVIYIDDLEAPFEHYRLLLGLYYRRHNSYF